MKINSIDMIVTEHEMKIIDDEAIIKIIENNCTVHLNKTATIIWMIINKNNNVNIENIAEELGKLIDEKSITKKQIVHDINSIIDQWLKIGLLKVHNI